MDYEVGLTEARGVMLSLSNHERAKANKLYRAVIQVGGLVVKHGVEAFAHILRNSTNSLWLRMTPAFCIRPYLEIKKITYNQQFTSINKNLSPFTFLLSMRKQPWD
jgi:hypothetical protein